MNKLFKILLTFFAFLRFSAVPLFCLAGCLFTFHSNSQWVQQQIPTGQLVQDIHFLDSLHGWLACSNGAVNDSGVILYTSTGGTSWVRQYAQVNKPLMGIRMANLNTGYCIGRASLKTTNSGANWFDMAPNGNFAGSISLPGADTIYVSEFTTSNGVWKSTNGGLNFIVSFSGGDSRKVFFINNQTGWAITSSFNLRRTTNGGTNWNLVHTFTDSMGDIFFINENTGWVNASGTTGMQKTVNGGLNFTQQTTPSGSFGFGGLFMLNENTGWSGGIGNQMHKTTNSGLNWILFTGLPIFTTRKINFINEITGWCATSGLAKSTNGGIMALTQITNIGPKEFSLYQNYPNPFNPATNIKYQISVSSFVKLKVFDILGREIIVLVNQKQSAGTYQIDFDGSKYSSGVYFYRIEAEEPNGNKFVDSKKMVLLK